MGRLLVWIVCLLVGAVGTTRAATNIPTSVHDKGFVESQIKQLMTHLQQLDKQLQPLPIEKRDHLCVEQDSACPLPKDMQLPTRPLQPEPGSRASSREAICFEDLYEYLFYDRYCNTRKEMNPHRQSAQVIQSNTASFLREEASKVI